MSDRVPPSSPTPELLQGTLEVMILSTLSRGALHGYGLAREIERASHRVLTIEEGSLYPALYRLAKRGDITSQWKVSDTGRRAKFYELTRQGKTRMTEQAALWSSLSKAVTRVIASAGERRPRMAMEGAE